MSLGPELQFLFTQDLETSKNPQLVSPQCLRLHKLIGKACSFFFPSLEFWHVKQCFLEALIRGVQSVSEVLRCFCPLVAAWPLALGPE